MGRNSSFAAIDVGTTKICTLIAEVNGDYEIQITGVGVAPAQGLRKGIVVNIDETIESIQSSVDKAERASGNRILSAYVGIAGSHISSLNNRGVIAISRNDRLITREDVTRVLESARTISIPSNREVLHVIPRSYILDGQEGVKNPVGMHGYRLDVETHIVTGAVTSIQNLTKCVTSLGVEVEDLVLEPIASAEAILTDEEKEMGVAVVDIGGGTTDLAIFMESSIWHTAVLPVGGYHLTNDIAIGLRTPFASAEEIKLRYGYALPELVDAEEEIHSPGFASTNGRRIRRRHLCEVIKARLEEMLSMVAIEIKRSGYDAMLPAGVVLTGGTSNLLGIDNLASDVLELPVRVGGPKGIIGVTESLQNPAFATSVGLLLWGIKHGSAQRNGQKARNGLGMGGFYKRLALWVRELLPQ
ncbi:MAG: cell division protein FtsA [Chloroflexi bacterium]|nr:cell division protein FtsA [Chloroflexota bacterium]